MVKKPLVIIGAGGHAVSVASLAISLGFNPIMFVDSNSDRSEIHGIPVQSNLDSISTTTALSCVMGIGDNYSRHQAYMKLITTHPNFDFPTLIHQQATIGSWSKIEQGCTIFAGARIGASCKIGAFAIMNTNASLDHDSYLAEFASLGPGVVTGGQVFIDAFSAVGIGSVIKHGLKIEEHSVIGSSSNVLKNIQSYSVVFGNPAEWQRSRSAGEPYL